MTENSQTRPKPSFRARLYALIEFISTEGPQAFAAAAPKDKITEGADAPPQPGRAAPATSAKGAPRP